MESIEENANSTSPIKTRVWCVVLFLGLLLLFVHGVSACLALNLVPPFLFRIHTSAVNAQLLMLGLIAGWFGRNWLLGVLLACVWAILAVVGQIVIHLLGSGSTFIYIGGMDSQWDLIWFVFYFPIVICLASSTLLLGRMLFGLRLAFGNEEKTLRVAIGLEEMLLVTACIAALIGGTSVPRRALESIGDNSAAIFVGALSMAIFLGMVGYSFGLIAFWIPRTGKRWCGYFCASLVIAGIVMAFSIADGTIDPLQALRIALMDVGLSLILFIGFLECLRFSGFRLVRYESKSEYRTRLDAGMLNEQLGIDRKWNRILTACLLIVMVSSSFIAWVAFSSGLQDRETVVANLTKVLEQENGSIGMKDGKITDLKLGPATTDQDLAQYTQYRDIVTLDLSNTQVTDLIFVDLLKFSQLQSLNLASTKITDQVAQLLPRHFRLEHLSVAGTSLSREMLLELASQIPSVDIGNLNLTDEDIGWLFSSPRFQSRVRSLLLGGNKELTDACIPNLSLVSSYDRIDLSGTSITGTGFRSSIIANELILHDCPLTDDGLRSCLDKLLITKWLSLSKTQLTDACLPDLLEKSRVEGLRIGDGNFTEDGFARTNRCKLTRLALNGQQFTGACFRSWTTPIVWLDMSHSGISDDSIASLSGLRGVKHLSLANTSITDKGLSQFVNAPLLQCDLSHTRVTAKGILDMPGKIYSLVVAPGQFTTQELTELRKKMKVSFELKEM